MFYFFPRRILLLDNWVYFLELLKLLYVCVSCEAVYFDGEKVLGLQVSFNTVLVNK